MKKVKIVFLIIICVITFLACQKVDNAKNKPIQEFEEAKKKFYQSSIIYEIQNKLSDNNSILELFTIKDIKIETAINENIISLLNNCISNVDNEGNIYLVGYKGEIYKLSSQGKLIKKFHQIGRGPGEYIGIADICVDDAKNIYILDIWQKLIIKYNSSFEYLDSFRYGNGNATKLNLNDKGNLIVFTTISESDPLTEINKDNGEIIRTFGQPELKTKKYGFAFFPLGSLFNFNKKYYYIFPLSYQLFITDSTNKTNVVSYKSSYFSDVKEVIMLSKTKKRHDVIANAIPINEELLLLHIKSFGERELGKSYDHYEIVSIYGDIINEKIQYNYSYSIYGQIEPGKLFSIYYKEAENDIIDTYLRILDFKLD